MISYYDLLGMIKEGNAPGKIRLHLVNYFREYEAVYDMGEFNYYSLVGDYDDNYKDYLIDCFLESCIFDENIEILEQDIKDISKIETFDDYTAKGNLHTYMYIKGNKCQVSEVQQEIIKKLNQIIDRLCTK